MASLCLPVTLLTRHLSVLLSGLALSFVRSFVCLVCWVKKRFWEWEKVREIVYLFFYVCFCFDGSFFEIGGGIFLDFKDFFLVLF